MVSAVVVTSRLQFTTTEGCPDTFDQIVYIKVPNVLKKKKKKKKKKNK
jgi:hypothetical protein